MTGRLAVPIETRSGGTVEREVARIVEKVRREGDEALRELTRKLDGARRRTIEVLAAERRAGARSVDAETRKALRFAAARIARFARQQKRSLRPFRLTGGGVVLEQRLLPVERVGLYVPGGRHPLCSTVLMGAIPARVAGCREVILCTPPRRDGSVAPEILAAAEEAGVDRVFAAGGAQAIAAMAFGTRSIPAADLVVGPGNRYVAAAKALVAGAAGIDFVAGPTELLVIADRSADPETLASDLLAQAEHDADARLWLLALGEKIVRDVRRHLQRQIHGLPAGSPIRQAAESSLSRIEVIQCGSRAEACEAANRIAPEHLSVQVSSPRALLPRLVNYGSLFIGSGSAVALGDYVSGPNHILPTAGAARHSGGLSVLRFLKVVTIQGVKQAGLPRLGRVGMLMASLEGLEAHARSIGIRLGERPVEAVLFDFNGVLIDDEEFHWRAFREVLRPFGSDLSRRLYDERYLAGDDHWVVGSLLKAAGVSQALSRRPDRGLPLPARAHKPNGGLALLETLVRRKRRAYRRLCGPGLRIEQPIRRLLLALSRRVPLAIVSGSAREEIEAVLARTGLSRLFRTIVSAEDVSRCKPHPEGYALAMRRLRAASPWLDAGHCLAIEDSPGGIQAARGAGLSVLAVSTSYPARALRQAGAARVIASLAPLSPNEILGGAHGSASGGPVRRRPPS